MIALLDEFAEYYNYWKKVRITNLSKGYARPTRILMVVFVLSMLPFDWGQDSEYVLVWYDFIGDPPGEDGSNAHFYVDDVFVTADAPIAEDPFVAPGRRKIDGRLDSR